MMQESMSRGNGPYQKWNNESWDKGAKLGSES